MELSTFIVDCSFCKAKVAAEETGVAEESGYYNEIDEPYASKLHVGKCPRCKTLLAGLSTQTGFEGWNSDDDEWSDVQRIYPKPGKAFISLTIPKVVTQSLAEGEKCLQAGAISAACVMFGRALEGLCRDKLIDPKEAKPKKLMLGQGLTELKKRNIIDQRLLDWSQHLQAFRNLGAHADGGTILREDAEDLQAFVYAIVEYIYDLTDRYEEFKTRVDKRKKKIELATNPVAEAE